MTGRKKICGRAITAGPGSCWYWWEGCPQSVRHCFNRFIRESGGEIDRSQAEDWDRQRTALREPEPKLL